MANMPWFRLYSELINDKKIERICRMTQFTKAEVVGVWVILLSLSSDSPVRGVLLVSETVPFELDDFEHITGMDRQRIEDLFDLFMGLDMLTLQDGAYSIANWNDRQFKSDDSSSYVSKHRKSKDVILHGKDDVILHNPKCNIIDTDTESYTDTDTELINDSAREKEFSSVWEKETGTPISNAYQFFQMLDEFKKVGVTPEIYRQAIQEQKQSNYAVNSPTSVKTWAIGMVTQKRDQRRQSDNGKRPAKITSDDNERIAKEVMDEYLANRRR